MLTLIARQFNFEVKILPPYSPVFNAIEECFADIKREIRTLLSVTLRNQVLQIAALYWGQKKHARNLLLHSVLTTAVNLLTVPKIQAHVQHVYSFLPKALNQDDL